ncbi:MAG: hypothetical protein H7Y32_13035 [Chloroflexales bacterium]|nr:hypothetical protein [Chloroflexales bacterium]
MSRAYRLLALGALLSLLLGACGARDDAQTTDATPVAAYPYPPPYPYPLPAKDTPSPSPPEPSATSEASATPAAATASSATAEATAAPEPSATPETATPAPSATAQETATPQPSATTQETAAATRFYTPIPSNTSELPKSPTPTSDETLAGLPISQIDHLSFADPLHGWLMGHACATEGESCSTPVIDATQDGGQTWQRLPIPMVRQPDGATIVFYDVSQLLFTSKKDGWLLAILSLKSGNRWSTQPLLAVTHDGGQTWEQDQHSGGVSVLGYAAGTVWIIDTITTAEKRLRLLLHQSADNGDSWQDSEALLPAEASQLRFNRLVRVGANNAWLMSTPGHAGIVATRDGGRNWTYVANPCPQFSSLTPLDHSHLWMMCEGEPAVGMQERQLYQSRDGGKRWHLIAKSEDLGNRISCEGECTLSTDYGGDMQCVSNHTCYIRYRLGLAISRDGGRTWSSAIDDAVTQGDSPTRDLLFIDEQHGWMTATNNVYRTTDGGASWQRVAVP